MTEPLKAQMELLPAEAMLEVGRVLAFGAAKYGSYNWMHADRSGGSDVGAAIRHILKDLAGQQLDEESGLYHLAHAITRLLFVLEGDITDGTEAENRTVCHEAEKRAKEAVRQDDAGAAATVPDVPKSEARLEIVALDWIHDHWQVVIEASVPFTVCIFEWCNRVNYQYDDRVFPAGTIILPIYDREHLFKSDIVLVEAL